MINCFEAVKIINCF
ncbi:hypothetical protein [Bacteroides thetaiotaomicron]